MLGAGLQINRSRGEDRFYNPAKARRNYHHNQKNYQLQRTQSDVVNGGTQKKAIVSGKKDRVREPENVQEESPKLANLPCSEQVESSFSNMERFLEAIAPSLNAQYLPKTKMRGWRTCDVEFQPYFMLSDLWESYREWSAYGAGVPLVLDGSDSVVQYYVPYLSAIQIYVDQPKSPAKSRRSEDSDGDFFSRDSSSDGSSDSERDRGLMYSQQSHCVQPNEISQKMESLFLRDQHTALQEGFSSDEGEFGNSQGCLLFEYFEHDSPFRRKPLADKMSSLASQFPKLELLRSCDLLSSSWFSVAWYPIYRIPTGSTLKDLDACFLTYHSLSTPIGDVPGGHAPVVIYPSEIDGIPRISLPVFGLACYKFRQSLWVSNNGSDRQLLDSLCLAADNWLRVLQVDHPDYLYFIRNRLCR